METVFIIAMSAIVGFVSAISVLLLMYVFREVSQRFKTTHRL